jgi:hypothetical protein
MSGEEREGQQREIFGLDVAHCDLCGMPTPTVQLREIESPSMFAEHDHALSACPTCWERVMRGEIDVESLVVIDEDERRGRGRES